MHLTYSYYWDAYTAHEINIFERGTPESKAIASGWSFARSEEIGMKELLGITGPSVTANGYSER